MLILTIYPARQLKRPVLLILSFCVLSCEQTGSSETSFQAGTSKREENGSVLMSSGKDYALFFAVQRYQDDKIPDLRNPIREAEAIAKVLKDQYNFETEIYRNPKKQTILDVLMRWQSYQFEKNSHLFIFFTGHGIFKKEFVTGYFIPQDGIWDDRYHDSYIGLPLISNTVTEIPCDHILLAIDACYSGTIDPNVAFKDLDLKSIPETLDSLTTSKSFSDNNDILAYLKAPPIKSRLIITSGLKEKTPDPSPFSRAILKALEEEHTEPYKDSMLTYHELLAYLDPVQPTPYNGSLHGHEKGGGFVFISDKYEGSGLRPNGGGGEIGKQSTPQTTDIQVIGSEEEETFLGGEDLISDQEFQEKDSYIVNEIINFKISFKKMPDGRFWLSENLDLERYSSYCNNNNTDDCTNYGRLYTWEAAKEACEVLGNGWKLPNVIEWGQLIAYFGGFKEQGRQAYYSLEANGGSGFNASLGGYWQNERFEKANGVGYYWTSTSYSAERSKIISFERSGSSVKLMENIFPKKSAVSCRCIK